MAHVFSCPVRHRKTAEATVAISASGLGIVDLFAVFPACKDKCREELRESFRGQRLLPLRFLFSKERRQGYAVTGAN